MTLTIPLLILRAGTLVAGAVFVVYALQAYRAHRAPAMLWLAIAIGLMALGAGIEIAAYLVFGASLGVAEVIEASVALLAFIVLLLAVRLQRA